MSLIVPRTVTLVEPRDDRRRGRQGLSLSDFRPDHGYVLLGEPGMGKSTEFETEAGRTGASRPIAAQRFMSRGIGSLPGPRQGVPLFIDGLDEARAGGVDPRRALQRIVARLEELGNPRFRLSCRAGSWLGPGDRGRLSRPGGDAGIPVLQLDPLCREGARRIVARRRDAADEFILAAFEHRLDAFLRNPQLLDVLLRSVEAAGWPETPGAAFERACRELAKEPNLEHRDARQPVAQPSRTALLSEAGRLSALMLIAGRGGWTAADSDDSDIISLSRVHAGNREALLAALDSRLFRGPSTRRVPAHRLVAEFLGARFLDERIRACDGVTVRRVLSLLTGEDGIPLPDLRGLSAWLAAAHPWARASLIRADPVAVAFNGDASGFTAKERGDLFEGLERSPELARVWPSAVALGALAEGRGRSAIRGLAASSSRSDARQHLVLRLLSGFSRMHHARAEASGDPHAHSDSDRVALLDTVRDPTWWSDVRRQALHALNLVLAGHPTRRATLGGLLADIGRKRLPDERNELLGTLLDIMYPEDLPAAEVWDHLTASRHPHHGTYRKFWMGLADRSSDERIGELLDSLWDRASEVAPRLSDHRVADVVLKLLARGLDLFGNRMTVPAVHRWFDLVEVDLQRSRLVAAGSWKQGGGGHHTESEEAIEAWLRSRENVRFELVEFGLQERESEIGRVALDVTISRKFLGREPPAGVRRWCLARAVELCGARPRIAEELARWAVRDREDWPPPVPDDEVARAVGDTPPLREWNRKRLEGKARREHEDVERKRRRAEERRRFGKRRLARVEPVRRHAKQLAVGRCPPALLHELAQVYFDGVAEHGPVNGPAAALAVRLADDETLVEAALAGLRRLPEREDLPDLTEIAKLHEKRRLSYLVLPFLAGLAEDERAGVDPLARMGKPGRRRALGYHLVSGLPSKRYSSGGGPPVERDARPPWYLRALESHPGAVADAFSAVQRARVRAKDPPDRHLYDLALDPAYGRVRPAVAERMLSVFPTRCTKPQVESLRLVLWAATGAGGMPTARLREVVLRRLERRGVDVAQRAQWLGAGLCVAKDECLPLLADFLATGGEARVRHVVDFFVSHDPRRRGSISLEEWRDDELAGLIRSLGGRVRRFDAPTNGGFLEDEDAARMKFQPVLASWIRTLAGRTSDEAADALESLASDPVLGPWRTEIVEAREDQAMERRIAGRETLTLEQVQHALQGRAPASAADLAALSLDTLERLADHIRNGPTSDWRQYWHRDPESRIPVKPQHENDCRDMLLSDLVRMLRPYNVDARPGSRYADDARADIRVAFGPGLAIPVEIRKNSHRDIWRAVDEQLVAQYVPAPESGGYGIYLVFWFGPDYMTVVPPRGRLPATPAKLKERLEEQLAPGIRRRIGIVVIDVSRSGRYAGDRDVPASASVSRIGLPRRK